MKNESVINKCPICGHSIEKAVWKDYMYVPSTGRTQQLEVEVELDDKNLPDSPYSIDTVYEYARKRVEAYGATDFTLASSGTNNVFGNLLPNVGAYCMHCNASL